MTNPVTYIEQISYLIFLKLLDKEEQDCKLRARLGANRGNARLLSPRRASCCSWG